MLRFFVKDVPPGRLFASDVSEKMVALTSSTNPWATIVRNSPLPPIELEDGSFDLVYLYSVLSHLSEVAHTAWVKEFGRLIRPGGLLIATTWPREYIEWCEAARQGRPSPVHHPGGLNAFRDTNKWLSAYDAGSFCYSPTGAGPHLTPDFYGETCVPRVFADVHWADWFDIVDFIDDRSRFTQNVFIARRKTSP
jgi:SAM-dependent methyltransferase